MKQPTPIPSRIFRMLGLPAEFQEPNSLNVAATN